MPPAQEFLALQAAVTGRYSLERELGRGGMGIVFLARDVALDRPVAIKLLPPALAERSDLRDLFLREARTAAKLSHPHIVPIHAVEACGEIVFFVMAYVDGETLGARVRRSGPLAPGEVMRIVQEVAWALGHAHARGVVHRDIKPDNILLERDTGRALVTDFGIAQVVRSLDREAELPAGTPRYMSPEQANGEAVDGRSDLYALGATAFFAATGRAPFEAGDKAALLFKHAHEPPPHIEQFAPRLPSQFASAVQRLLAKAPDERYASAEEVAEAVRTIRGAVGSVPGPVRRYVVESGQVANEVANLVITNAAAVLGLELVIHLSGAFPGILRSFEVVATTVLLAIAGARIGHLIRSTRELVSAGYRHGAVRAAIVAEDRERDLDHAPAPVRTGTRTWIVAVGGVGVSALGFWFMSVTNVLSIVGWLTGLTAPLITARYVWRDVQGGRRGTFWNRLLGGRLGRFLFRVAGIGVRSQEAPFSAEPTAVVLGRAAEDLFHALPSEQRRRLGDVPALIARIQLDIAALRERDAADPARARRLEAAVTTLENLRLDLLRLHAGQGSVDDLTADIARAMEVREEVDAAIEADGILLIPQPGDTT